MGEKRGKRNRLKSLLASLREAWQGGDMPHRPPRKVKKDKSATDGKNARSQQTEAQRRLEMATRSTLTRFQNRSSDRK